jgi:hypothetical protein
MKKTWFAILGFLLLAAPATVQAQFECMTNADGVTLTITNYAGPGGDVVIPTNIDGLLVTGIANSAFYFRASLTNVTIPGSVTTIGNLAFSECFNITNLTIADGVTTIGNGAFSFCEKLTSLTIPGSVTNLGLTAFEQCLGLTNLAISQGVPSIGEGAFENCLGLTSVMIPNSVTNIGGSAFQECTGLTNVTIPGSVVNLGESAFESCTSLASVTIPASVTNIGSSAFEYCTSLTNAYFEGNAPMGGSELFANGNSQKMRVYYLPGTTGWSSNLVNSFSALVVLWNALIQAAGTSFGLSNNQFGFNITGTSNIPIVVEACADLADPAWTPLQALTLTNGLFYFADPQWTNYPERFYRISSP